MPGAEVLILGAGPAGLGAAIQLKRYGVGFTLIEKDSPGGLLKNANLVENYPGFPGGIRGIELVELFAQHAAGLGVDVTRGEVKKLSCEQDLFRAETREAVFCGRVAVVATGTKPKRLGAAEAAGPEVKERVFYEIFPIREMGGATVAIVGGGDLAFDYGLNLGMKNQVVILNRGGQTRCLPVLWERASQLPALAYRENTEIQQITAEGKRLRLVCLTAGERFTLTVDYVLGAIGREPQVDFISPELFANAPELEKSEKLYWIGDVKNGIYRQAAISAGNGLLAAMKIYEQMKGTAS